MKTFGTLRRDSYFTPSEVLEEAQALNASIKLLGRARFESAKDFDTVAMASWNAFVLRWKNFYNRIGGNAGVVASIPGTYSWDVRALDSSRDILLNFEDDFAVFLGATEVTSPGSTPTISAPKPVDDRTEDNINHAIDEIAKGAKKAAAAVAFPLVTVLVIGGIAYVLLKRKVS